MQYWLQNLRVVDIVLDKVKRDLQSLTESRFHSELAIYNLNKNGGTLVVRFQGSIHLLESKLRPFLCATHAGTET